MWQLCDNFKKTVDIYKKAWYYIHNDKKTDKENIMSDFYNNDDIVSSVDQSKADIISRLDEIESRIEKIFEIVENMEANLNG